MAISDTHPEYKKYQQTWMLCTDSWEGEDAIKARSEHYLPATSGQIEDGALASVDSEGGVAYRNYLARAIYPEIYQEALLSTIGILHRKPAVIELPSQMESMLEAATGSGESLQDVLRKINFHQINTGRLGLLGDIVVRDGAEVPRLVIYEATAILNWDSENPDNPTFYVLDESGYKREGLTWVKTAEYRVCALAEGDDLSVNGTYVSGVFEENVEFSATGLEAPSVKGQVLRTIPFVCINSQDLALEPAKPPFLGTAKSALAIYRGEADYRQNLFMQGQDTFVTTGANLEDDESVRMGAGAHINLPVNGDAKFVGVSSNGLPEQRQALENDYQRASVKAGQMINTNARGAESGEALKIRKAAQTATLPQIAKTGAAGLTKVLKDLAVWLGANPDDVSVTPHLEFTDAELDGQNLQSIMNAKALGAPVSNESIHAHLVDQGLAAFSYETELEKINEEIPVDGLGGNEIIGDIDANS